MKNYLKSFNILTDDEIDYLFQVAKSQFLKKDDYFIREGERCQSVAFVLEGIFRSFYAADNGEEITYCITFPHNLMTAYSSFITGQNSEENIQAITPVQLLIIDKQTIDNLVSQSSNWVHFMKTIAEQQYIELEKRIFKLQKSSASQRYWDLIQNQPEFVKHIPLHYLASYLGISQRHLSRIRKEITFKTNVLIK